MQPTANASADFWRWAALPRSGRAVARGLHETESEGLGFWSSVTSFGKKVWRAIKGAARQLGRIIAEAAHRLIVGLPDLLLGFLTWPPKKLRIKILILSDQRGVPVASPADLAMSIDYAKRVFKDRLNVKLLPHPGTEKPMVEIILDPAPPAAIEVSCGVDAGEEKRTVPFSYCKSG